MPTCRGVCVEYRQQDGISESKIITTLSATPTIVVLTVLAAIVFRWMFGRWRESLVVIYAVVGETAIFMATTLFIDRPRPECAAPGRRAADVVVPVGPHRRGGVLLRFGRRDRRLAQPRSGGSRVVAVILCAAVPLTIAGSRVYRGMHYPTDVLAGALLGAIWLSIVIFYVRRHDAGGRRDAAVDADARLVNG